MTEGKCKEGAEERGRGLGAGTRQEAQGGSREGLRALGPGGKRTEPRSATALKFPTGWGQEVSSPCHRTRGNMVPFCKKRQHPTPWPHSEGRSKAEREGLAANGQAGISGQNWATLLRAPVHSLAQQEGGRTECWLPPWGGAPGPAGGPEAAGRGLRRLRGDGSTSEAQKMPAAAAAGRGLLPPGAGLPWPQLGPLGRR